MDKERRRLMQAFIDSGQPVDDLAIAWTGLYPFWHGYSSWGYFFTRHRCIIKRDENVEVWTTWSGLPSKALAGSALTDCRYARQGKRYDRVDVGEYRVWTAVEDRERILGWARDGE